MVYLTCGYPDYETSLAAGKAALDSGADLLEIGVPFSDPLADGPVIQAASQAALERGTTVEDAFDLARRFRRTPPLSLLRRRRVAGPPVAALPAAKSGSHQGDDRRLLRVWPLDQGDAQGVVPFRNFQV